VPRIHRKNRAKLAVSFEVSGTAVRDDSEDYDPIGTVACIPDGETSEFVPVRTHRDNRVEPGKHETVVVTLKEGGASYSVSIESEATFRIVATRRARPRC
jgi:hypothetical protein